jgi:hypothetical protein
MRVAPLSSRLGLPRCSPAEVLKPLLYLSRKSLRPARQVDHPSRRSSARRLIGDRHRHYVRNKLPAGRHYERGRCVCDGVVLGSISRQCFRSYLAIISIMAEVYTKWRKLGRGLGTGALPALPGADAAGLSPTNMAPAVRESPPLRRMAAGAAVLAVAAYFCRSRHPS